MNVGREKDFVHTYRPPARTVFPDAYLWEATNWKTDTTSQFFTPAVNCYVQMIKVTLKEVSQPLAFLPLLQANIKCNRFCHHYHTHVNKTTPDKPFAVPQRLKDGSIKMGSWQLQATYLSGSGSFRLDVRFSSTYHDAAVTSRRRTMRERLRNNLRQITWTGN